MKKNKQLNQWLWKWHIISGLISMPFMALLCATGAIYLFKGHFDDYTYQDARFIDVVLTQKTYSYSDQLEVVQSSTEAHIVSVTLPQTENQATAFRQHGKGHARHLTYVDPYTNKITGEYKQKESFMQTVRKLHGELLLGRPGELFIELIASWVIVLALTGVYVWWPYKKFTKAGFFSLRTKKSRKLFWRDMHSVVGFWMSAFLLILLAGGMPWTELFGDNLKWVQKQTDTGYPQHWRNSKGLSSDLIQAQQEALKPIILDDVVNIAMKQNLAGVITIKLPQDEEGVYTIENRSMWLEDQKVTHIDQYDGSTVKSLEWNQVGILMVLRQVFMRLHQGEYGLANLIAALIVALALFVSTVASMVSYVIRKPKGRWGLPKVPESFNAGLGVVFAITALALLFPAFGLSLVLILLLSWFASVFRKVKSPEPRIV